MESKGQHYSCAAQDDERPQNKFAATGSVEYLAHEWLDYPAYKHNQCGCYRDSKSVPAEVVAHWNNEHSKAITCANRNESYEYAGGANVPTEVNRFLSCLTIWHLTPRPATIESHIELTESHSDSTNHNTRYRLVIRWFIKGYTRVLLYLKEDLPQFSETATQRNHSPCLGFRSR